MPQPYFSDELEQMRAQIARFITQEVMPQGEAWEESGEVPRAVLRQMGSLGFLGIRHEERFGGLGLGPLGSVVLAEECGLSGFGGFSATVLVHTDMASPHLRHAGNEAQWAEFMPAIVRGEAITAIAVTEPDAGSDVAGMKSRARRDGADWVLNGSKMFITNGALADVYFVAARTDPEAKGSRGISIFVLRKGAKGFTVSRRLRKHGWLCSDTAELSFDDVRIPAADMLGEENRGFYAIMKNFQNERLVLGAMAVGECRRALEITKRYVAERKAFGATLLDKQAIRQRLAMREAETAAAQQLVYHAAWLMEQGIDAVKEVSMVKALCGELVNHVTYDCLQFHGGAGYLRDSAIERMARDARIHPIGGGATEVMLEEIAKRWAV